jgi:outer membrane protein OmpA-like peptidoglycan-associated protein/outer membrane protein W
MKPASYLAGLIIGISLMMSTSFAQHTSGQLGLSAYASGIKLIGGEGDHSIINYASSLSLKYSFSKTLTSEIVIGLGWVRPRDPDSHFKVMPGAPYRTYLYPWNLNLRFNFFPDQRIIPYIGAGAGITYWNLRDISEEDKWFPIPESGSSISGRHSNFTTLGMLGVTFFITKKIGLDLGGRYLHLFDQKLDNIGTDDINNGLVEVRLGLGFFFGGIHDSDKDGIENKNDQCPDEPEDFDGFEDDDGCPEIDNDDDGIPDYLDQCPNEMEDLDGFEDDDGCPDLDNDNDSITDKEDKCPNEPEDFDGIEDDDGCPELDNDGDGIPDHMDKCPDQAETFNDYLDEDGCPDEKPEPLFTEDRIKLVLPEITFASGKTTLTENAMQALDKVFQSLQAEPEIHLEIRGYTDSIGSSASNLNLSQRRAETVKDYLVKKGVVFERLRAIGYGEANPIASNKTQEGRAKNRRIEFVLIED